MTKRTQPPTHRKHSVANGEPDQTRPQPVTRARRWRRRALIALVAAPFALLGAGLVVARTPVLRMIIEPRLESALNCRVSSATMVIDWDGALVATGVSLRASDVGGQAGEIVAADRIVARFDWPALLTGGGAPTLTSLRFERPVVRLSRSAADGSFNVEPLLAGFRTGGSSGPTGLPSVDIFEGVVTFGEHAAGLFEPLIHMQMSGGMAPSDPARRVYSIQLTQDNPPGEKAMRIDGRVDLETGGGRLSIDDIDLAQWRFGSPARSGGELWRQLAIEGAISNATFEFEAATGVATAFVLNGVNLTMPVPVEPDPETGRSDRLMRMRAVDGVIRFDSAGLHADLTGLVEDFPARVRLDTQGLALNSALRCEIATDRFAVSRGARLLPFAPREVHDLFADFSFPSMEVTGAVVFARGAPPSPVEAAPFQIDGAINFERGVAAHKAFPYPVTDLRGAIRFDRDRVELVKITGVGPTGARLLAEGWIETGSKQPGEILITALDVPFDDQLIDAMPERHRDIAVAVCSRPAYDAMAAEGLVQSAARRAELERQAADMRPQLARLLRESGSASARIALLRDLSQVEELLNVPVFDLGGRLNIDIALRRKRGERFLLEVEAEAPRMGVAPRWFPYPGTAHDLKIHIDRERVLATASLLTSPTGAVGSIDVAVQMNRDEDRKPSPRVDIELSGVPIDGLLLRALRREGETMSPGDVLERLEVRGLVDRVTASIASRPDQSIGYTVGASFAGVEAGPVGAGWFDGSMSGLRRGGEERGVISGLSGSLQLTEDIMTLGPVVGSVGDGAIELRVDSSRAAAGERELAASLEMLDLDIAAPIERVIHAISPDLASRIATLRSETRLAGQIDATARINVDSGGAIESRAEITRARGVAFDIPGGRATLNSTGGVGVIGPGTAYFDQVRSSLLLNDVPAGDIALDGRLALNHDGPTDLRLAITGARFEALPLREAVALGAGGVVASWWLGAEPRGEFDAELQLAGSAGSDLSLEGAISPRSLTIASGGVDVIASATTGRVVFGPAGGRLERLSAQADGWVLEADGAWSTGEASGLRTSLALRSESLSPQISALLPHQVGAAFDEMGLRIDAGFTLRDAELAYSEAKGVEFLGVVDFEGASLDAGVVIREMSGAARIRASGGARAGRSSVDVEIAAESLRAAGLAITNARAHLFTDPNGAVVMPGFFADVYGGRVAGSLAVFPAVEGAIAYASADEAGGAGATDAARSRYQADVRFAGVDMAEAMGEFAGGAAPLRPGKGESAARMHAELSIAGAIGDRDSTRGRGLVSIEDGRFVRLPLLMRVLEIGNLQPPMGEGLDVAEAEFYIDGRRAIFERLLARSASIAVVGEGEASWPDLKLDLRFKTSGNLRLPFISDLIDAIRNELLTITVTGALDNPEFGSVQLPTTSRFLRDVFRAEPTRRDAARPHRGKQERRPQRE